MIHPRQAFAGAVMRGADEASGSLFSYVDLEARIPARHPLRTIRQVVNEALASLDGEFAALYTDFGRPSIPPERLIWASLIQILFSVRSERQLMEQMQYNLLFRWFVGLGIDDPVWVPTVFSKNRDRLLTTEMSRKVMAAILAHREVAPLLSDDHFSVDGTLVKAWASMKSFQPKASETPPDDDPGGPPGPESPVEDHSKQPPSETAPMHCPDRQSRNAEVDFRGEKRSKARFIAQVFDGVQEAVYASPPEGGAQTAIATVARRLGKRATIFVAARTRPHPRTLEAARHGAKVVPISPGYLSVVQSRAREYCRNTGASLIPFAKRGPGRVLFWNVAPLARG